MGCCTSAQKEKHPETNGNNQENPSPQSYPEDDASNEGNLRETSLKQEARPTEAVVPPGTTGEPDEQPTNISPAEDPTDEVPPTAEGPTVGGRVRGRPAGGVPVIFSKSEIQKKLHERQSRHESLNSPVSPTSDRTPSTIEIDETAVLDAIDLQLNTTHGQPNEKSESETVEDLAPDPEFNYEPYHIRKEDLEEEPDGPLGSSSEAGSDDGGDGAGGGGGDDGGDGDGDVDDGEGKQRKLSGKPLGESSGMDVEEGGKEVEGIDSNLLPPHKTESHQRKHYVPVGAISSVPNADTVARELRLNQKIGRDVLKEHQKTEFAKELERRDERKHRLSQADEFGNMDAGLRAKMLQRRSVVDQLDSPQDQVVPAVPTWENPSAISGSNNNNHSPDDDKRYVDDGELLQESGAASTNDTQQTIFGDETISTVRSHENGAVSIHIEPRLPFAESL